MRLGNRWLAALVMAAACVPTTAADRPAPVSPQAGELIRWVVRTRNHGSRPFAIVDKREARIHLFDRAGREQGSSSVLLGQAVGDDMAPDVGEHAQAGRVPFEERTTPAGRFVTEPGRNLTGEPVVWVHYESAFAIHRLRTGTSYKERLQRLASTSPGDKRASLGCVIVPESFYLGVVQRLLGEGPAVVYVMPENGSMRELLGAM